MQKAYSITIKELAERTKADIPGELVPNTHLIYSSPATLSFHSPGAEGFGVKRAGLAIPDSIMLLVAPGCCGRNTSALGTLGKDRERFFYYMMDDTDIVTGRHLTKIPKAVKEVYDSQEKKPSVVMICITCVDALLGTDMERVCKKASEAVGIPVLPCYMYALTREGRKPPMVHVRQSIYSLLTEQEKESTTVNLLGNFAPLMEQCELYDYLKQLGIRKINEISKCKDFEEYLDMGKANFNLVLNPEARYAAGDLQKRIHMPYAELTRLYQVEKIHNQYQIFAKALGGSIDDSKLYEETKEKVEQFRAKHAGKHVVIGGTLNANAYELALALISYGLVVEEIYANLTTDDFVYVKRLAEVAPDIRVYSNLLPNMIHYNCSEVEVDASIGKDAGYYHTGCPNLPWNADIVPFGYVGLQEFLRQLDEVLS